MSTDIVILNSKDIQKLYGFTREEVYRLLSIKGCPVLPRSGQNSPYKVIQDEFETWLRGRRA